MSAREGPRRARRAQAISASIVVPTFSVQPARQTRAQSSAAMPLTGTLGQFSHTETSVCILFLGIAFPLTLATRPRSRQVPPWARWAERLQRSGSRGPSSPSDRVHQTDLPRAIKTAGLVTTGLRSSISTDFQFLTGLNPREVFPIPAVNHLAWALVSAKQCPKVANSRKMLINSTPWLQELHTKEPGEHGGGVSLHT